MGNALKTTILQHLLNQLSLPKIEGASVIDD
jgi:hypothetical protein